MIDIHLKPLETLLFGSDIVAVGKFRCPSTHPLFRDTGPCSYHTIVFPRATTAIRHEGGASFVGGPNTVALYNQHQRYTRTKISDVDASDWYTLADDVLLDVVAQFDPRVRPERPFAMAEVPSDASSYLEQRAVFDALDRGEPLDPMHVDETILRVIGRVLARAHPRRAKVAQSIDAVEHVRTLIARDPSRNTPLRVLAREAHMSPFQLCRAFRARTGSTMTAYRHSLRLRLALERLHDRRRDLTTVALDLGYSSHSHFTSVFRRHFGVTPSAWRGR